MKVVPCSLWPSLQLALVFAAFVQSSYIHQPTDQALLSTHSEFDANADARPHTSPEENWDVPPDPDGTANYIFNSVSSAMIRWPMTLFKNGHSITGASIPTGTILYHGRPHRGIPTRPEWLAFDIEHSYIFGQEECYVYTFITTRPLRLAYFDGVSAGKLLTGTLDTQDLLIWGRARPDKWREEGERITKLCEWGRPFGLDGFVRMEFHFELLLCDFSQGLKVVSVDSLIPLIDDVPRDQSRRRQSRELRTEDQPAHVGLLPPQIPPPAPDGWRGSRYGDTAAYFEIMHAGSWHNHAPGETRVHVDYSRFVTFYDESLTSLVAARRGVPHLDHRIANISAPDLARAKEELSEVFGRDASVVGSGVDWASVTRVIIQRYSARLDVLKHILETEEFHNATEQASQVRMQLLIGLGPYITTDAVPAPGASPSANTSWAAPIVHHCSTTLASHVPDALLTRQELRIRDAVGRTLREICRVLTRMWVRAIAIEEADESEARDALRGWRIELSQLMAWLDWAEWVRCEPACGPDTICHLPTWPYDMGDDPNDMTPRCVRRYAPYTW
ncbi:hypothetical protein DENSPDRAFT_774482 [Dentipellis sp. KUC8613]|nr:hypothetical protein DENSPDRAFT_774482 [Dentipellis sp. KUC8613]